MLFVIFYLLLFYYLCCCIFEAVMEAPIEVVDTGYQIHILTMVGPDKKTYVLGKSQLLEIATKSPGAVWLVDEETKNFLVENYEFKGIMTHELKNPSECHESCYRMVVFLSNPAEIFKIVKAYKIAYYEVIECNDPKEPIKALPGLTPEEDRLKAAFKLIHVTKIPKNTHTQSLLHVRDNEIAIKK